MVTMHDQRQPRYAFSHFLIRDVIFEQMPDPRKQALNRQVLAQAEKQALVVPEKDRQEIVI